jgi:hypothetical protein
MIMFEQSRRLSEPLRWGRREKALVAALAACCVIAGLALGAFALTSGAPARRDCVSVTFASTLGGAVIHGCGARAREICAQGSAYKGIKRELQVACERARIPFGGSH